MLATDDSVGDEWVVEAVFWSGVWLADSGVAFGRSASLTDSRAEKGARHGWAYGSFPGCEPGGVYGRVDVV